MASMRAMHLITDESRTTWMQGKLEGKAKILDSIEKFKVTIAMRENELASLRERNENGTKHSHRTYLVIEEIIEAEKIKLELKQTELKRLQRQEFENLFAEAERENELWDRGIQVTKEGKERARW